MNASSMNRNRELPINKSRRRCIELKIITQGEEEH